jgi:hypothetical protein
MVSHIGLLCLHTPFERRALLGTGRRSNEIAYACGFRDYNPAPSLRQPKRLKHGEGLSAGIRPVHVGPNKASQISAIPTS